MIPPKIKKANIQPHKLLKKYLLTVFCTIKAMPSWLEGTKM